MALAGRTLNYQYEELVKGQIADQIPIYFVRYEDLLVDPVPALEGLFAFLLDVPTIEGTVVQKRIHDSCAKGTETKTVYKLKSTTKNVSKNVGKYRPEDIKYMKEEVRDYLYYFGYVNHPTEEHHTACFEYDNGGEFNVPHDQEKLNELFYGFRENNKRAIERASRPVAEGASKPDFEFNATFRERFKPTTLPNIADKLTIKL
jgi:hypothetical protein